MDTDQFLKCIVDPNRRTILNCLKFKELCVNDIIEASGLEQTLVSFHLKSLRMCGLVVSRREGKCIWYRISDDSITDLLKTVDQVSKKVKGTGDKHDCQ